MLDWCQSDSLCLIHHTTQVRVHTCCTSDVHVVTQCTLCLKAVRLLCCWHIVGLTLLLCCSHSVSDEMNYWSVCLPHALQVMMFCCWLLSAAESVYSFAVYVYSLH